MQSLLWLFLGLTLVPSWACAQFGFFDQMFQGGQQQGRGGHQHQQQQREGSSDWTSVADSVPCNKYLCPTTLVCVESPIECPCPYPEDIKCVIPDMGKHGHIDGTAGGTVVCVRGKDGCDSVNKLLL